MRNIEGSRRYLAASRDFNREGVDLEFRARNREAGIDNYSRMYRDPYSRETYMGLRGAQGGKG